MRLFNRWMNFLLAVMFVVLVACTEPATKIEYVPATARELYLEQVRSKFVELEAVPDNLLVELAKNTCEMLDVGGTADDLYSIGVEAGASPEMTGYMSGAAVAHYCPEHIGKF